MDLAKSNALSLMGGALGGLAQATTMPWGSKPTGPEAVMLGLVSVGLCALIVWIGRRIVHPGKLRLAPTPDRPNTINPIHILVLLLVWQGSGGVAQALLTRLLPEAPKEPLSIVVALIQQVIWLGTSLAVAAATFRHGLRRGLGLSTRHWMYDGARGVFAYLAVLPACFGLFLAGQALYKLLYHQPPPAHQMLTALRCVSWPWQAMIVVSAVVLAPWCEEVFCRGLLQSMFRRYTARPWAAVVLTSAIFALLHWNSLSAATGGNAPGATRGMEVIGAGWIQLPAMFVLGLVLGYNYERTGRLYAPILIHTLFNGVSVALFLAGGT
jgi:membrane protease YdiL (CAAX protease family)